MKTSFLQSIGKIKLVSILILLIFFLITCNKLTPPPSDVNVQSRIAVPGVSNGGTIHGSVTVVTKIEEGEIIVSVPDIKVYLIDISTGKTVTKTTTDIFGRYYFPLVPSGVYEIHWAAQRGWRAGQLNEQFKVKHNISYALPINLIPQRGRRAYVGQVNLIGGSASFFNEYYGIQSMPLIKYDLKEKQRANSYGQFAISSSSKSVDIMVSNSSKTFNLKNGIYGKYQMDNNIPRLLGFELSKGGTKIKYPRPGDGIQLRALVQDLDGDQLSYSWKVRQGISVQNFTTPTIKLKMPRGEGTILVDVLVDDKKGGMVASQYNIGYGQTEEIFSGLVYDRKTNTPIKDVDVNVNGKTAKTNEHGHFRFRIPIAQRYTVFIKKNGFTSYGQAFLENQRGKKFYIRKLKGQTINPGSNIELKDNGAIVRIPADCLVDKNGNLATTNLRADFALLDISDNEFPGDFLGSQSERQTGLISYGMIEVNIYDNKGNEYNLCKDGKAEVLIPLAGGEKNGNIREQAPNKIPIWFYNKNTGEWNRDGMATLDENRNFYRGQVSHFSTINMDQPGAVTMLKVLADPELITKFLRVSDVAGDGIDYATVKEVEIDKAINAIYRIPPNQKVKIEVLESSGGAVLSDVVIDVYDKTQPGLGWVLNPNDEVLAGNAVANLWPAYPYDESPMVIHLKNLVDRDNGIGPNYTSALSFKGIGSDLDATDYYNHVDPGSLRTTLEDWLVHNGYDLQTSPDDVVYGDHIDPTVFHNTSFLNFNDLGSGRNMNFLRRDDGTASSYVANYTESGLFDQNHDNADKAANREFLAPDLVATVCMEWSPIDDAANWYDPDGLNPFPKQVPPYTAPYLQQVRDNSVVKFFVFFQTASPQVNIPRSNFADLDGYQKKYVPNLCNNCHGGSPSSPYLGARFRELDYKTYKFDAGRLFTAITLAEKNSFKAQNILTLDGNNLTLSSDDCDIASDAIRELVNEWYPNLADVDQQIALIDGYKQANIGGGAFDPLDPQPEELYGNVVGKSCRTCHISFDGLQDFNTYNDFLVYKGVISSYVNGPSIVMPHAVITYRNFWTHSEPEIELNGGVLNEIGTDIIRADYLQQYEENQWTPNIGN